MMTILGAAVNNAAYELNVDGREREERKLLTWIYHKFKRETWRVWGVRDMLLFDGTKSVKKIKRLNRCIKFLQRTTKNNGLADWLILKAVAIIVQHDVSEVVRLEYNEDVLHLLQRLTQSSRMRELPEPEMTIPQVVAWLEMMASPMLPIILTLQFGMSRLDWTSTVGFFLLCEFTEDSEFFGAVFPNKSMKKHVLPEIFWCVRSEVGISTYIDLNWFEKLATIKTVR